MRVDQEIADTMRSICSWFMESELACNGVIEALGTRDCKGCGENHAHPLVDIVLPLRYLMGVGLSMASENHKWMVGKGDDWDDDEQHARSAGLEECIGSCQRLLHSLQNLIDIMDEVELDLTEYIKPPPVTCTYTEDEAPIHYHH